MPNAYNEIVLKDFNSATVVASGTFTTTAISLKEMRPLGNFSFQATVSIGGTFKLQYLLSNDNQTFILPIGAVDIAAGLNIGNHFGSFDPPTADSMKILVTETGGTQSGQIEFILAIQ